MPLMYICHAASQGHIEKHKWCCLSEKISPVYWGRKVEDTISHYPLLPFLLFFLLLLSL